MMNRKRLVKPFLLAIALSACADQQSASDVIGADRALSFMPETNATEFWTNRAKYPSNPYVMWVTNEQGTRCDIPIFRTGYRVSWLFIRSVALENDTEEVAIKVCPGMPDRCYLASTDWLGAGLEEAGFAQAEACDPELEIVRE